MSTSIASTQQLEAGALPTDGSSTAADAPALLHQLQQCAPLEHWENFFSSGNCGLAPDVSECLLQLIRQQKDINAIQQNIDKLKTMPDKQQQPPAKKRRQSVEPVQIPQKQQTKSKQQEFAQPQLPKHFVHKHQTSEPFVLHSTQPTPETCNTPSSAVSGHGASPTDSTVSSFHGSSHALGEFESLLDAKTPCSPSQFLNISASPSTPFLSSMTPMTPASATSSVNGSAAPSFSPVASVAAPQPQASVSVQTQQSAPRTYSPQLPPIVVPSQTPAPAVSHSSAPQQLQQQSIQQPQQQQQQQQVPLQNEGVFELQKHLQELYNNTLNQVAYTQQQPQHHQQLHSNLQHQQHQQLIQNFHNNQSLLDQYLPRQQFQQSLPQQQQPQMHLHHLQQVASHNPQYLSQMLQQPSHHHHHHAVQAASLPNQNVLSLYHQLANQAAPSHLDAALQQYGAIHSVGASMPQQQQQHHQMALQVQRGSNSPEVPGLQPMVSIRGARSRIYEDVQNIQELNSVPYKYNLRIELPFLPNDTRVQNVKKRDILNYRIDHDDIKFRLKCLDDDQTPEGSMYGPVEFEVHEAVNVERHVHTKVFRDRKEIHFKIAFTKCSYDLNNKPVVLELIDEVEDKVFFRSNPFMIRARRKKEGTKRSRGDEQVSDETP